MLGKAEGKHQVTEETEEQEGALPKDWRGRLGRITLRKSHNVALQTITNLYFVVFLIALLIYRITIQVRH
jgi:hypothetical protein